MNKIFSANLDEELAGWKVDTELLKKLKDYIEGHEPSCDYLAMKTIEEVILALQSLGFLTIDKP